MLMPGSRVCPSLLQWQECLQIRGLCCHETCCRWPPASVALLPVCWAVLCLPLLQVLHCQCRDTLSLQEVLQAQCRSNRAHT